MKCTKCNQELATPLKYHVCETANAKKIGDKMKYICKECESDIPCILDVGSDEVVYNPKYCPLLTKNIAKWEEMK